MPTVTDLGRLVKQKYPGTYDDLGDDELGTLVQQKYPGAYDDFTAGPPAAPAPTEQPGLLQQAGAALRQAVFPVPGEERAATVIASGALGAPADILNAPGAISGMLGGPSYRIPLGSADIAQAMGVDPQSMTALERIVQGTAGAVAPGVFLKAAQGMGILPGVAQKLYPLFSAGPRGDVILGAASAGGAEIGRQVTPGSAVGPIVGGIAGPAAVSAIHGAISAGVKALGKPTVARQDLQAAEQVLEESISPARAALEATVLKPRPGAAPSGPLATGAAVQETLAAQAHAIPAKAAQEGLSLIEQVGPGLDRMQTLATSKQFFQKEFFEKGRQNLGRLFEATEKVTGDAPVVDVTRFRDRAARMAAEATTLGQGAPQGAKAIAGLGVGADELLALLEGAGTPLSKAQRDLVSTIATEGQSIAIPFWMARRLESSLSQVAYRGAKPVGTIAQGKARALLGELQDDLHGFYSSEAATQASPAIETALQGVGGQGASIAEALPLAKQKYKAFIDTTNRTVISKLLSNDPVQQERFLKPFLAGGDQAQLLAVKQAASPEVWDTLGSFVLAELHRKASASGQFDPTAMAKELQGLRKRGVMDLLYSPEQVAAVERYAAQLATQEQGFLPALRATLQKKAPEAIPDYVFHPGETTRTQNYRSLVPPDVYDATVKAWAAQVQDDLRSLTPVQVRSKYGPMIRRQGGEPSQLDILLTDYPSAADQITAAIESVPGREAAITAAKEAVKTGSKLATTVEHMERYASTGLLLHGIFSGNPGSMGLGMAGMAAPAVARRWADTETGRQIIREGLAQRYGPASIGFALRALGREEEPRPLQPGTAVQVTPPPAP
jgi:hypothetical protein